MVWYKIHKTIILPDLNNTIEITTVFIYIFVYAEHQYNTINVDHLVQNKS